MGWLALEFTIINVQVYNSYDTCNKHIKNLHKLKQNIINVNLEIFKTKKLGKKVFRDHQLFSSESNAFFINHSFVILQIICVTE